MATIAKVLIGLITGLVLVSCNLNIGVRGNGNVKTIERNVDASFDEIEISRGLDVYLTQSDTERISVQADENLHDIIKTKIEGNVLKIYTKDNISYSEAQKVMISFKMVTKIRASSGSDVFSKGSISAQSIELNTDSGSDMKLDINAQSIVCSASSGSDLVLSGTTTTLKANASSGSEINAKSLKSETSHVTASSGADIEVNTSKELHASASSGADITYYGNPKKVEKSDGVSGSIDKQ